ncbi:MAG: hypothetical protein KatS3mg111_0425 [Pirellulaceae bacterium]|nr:MAG: hypothetical protein KatS3mg111_0425 [Pirellulaceae bacterium]
MTRKNHADHLESVRHLRQIIENAPVVMLTTVDPSGMLFSRPMVNINREFDGDFWLFTEFDDPKANEIRADSHVNVSIADIDHGRYASLSGTAKLVEDPKRVELLWTPECAEWFPDGPENSSLVLIHVEVATAAYWDRKQGVMGKLVGLLRRAITGDTSESIQHEVVTW